MKVWDSVKRLVLPSMASSYYPPNVTLHEWWLTSMKTYDGRDAIGVEGITAPIYQNQAERCFTSAPILKAFDYHGLETIDGIHIILDGNIDKEKTLKNGFPREVFNHFKCGFPGNWEEFAVDTGVQGVSSPLLDCDIFNVGIRVQGHDHAVFSNETITVPDVSSLAVTHEDIIEAGHGVLCEQSPLTSNIEDDPSLRMSPLNDVHDMKHKVITYDLATISKCSGVSGSNSRSLLQNEKYDVHGESQVATKKGDRVAKFSKAKLSDSSSCASVSDGFLVNASSDTAARPRVDYQETILTRTKSKRNLTSGSSARRQLIAISPKSSRTLSKADKKKSRKGRSSSPYREGTCNAAAAVRDRMDSQEAFMTRSKSKRKLTSESLAERKLRASHESVKKTSSKAKKVSKVIMLSPEAFGGKKSRFGRVLLPKLEFWRNQTVLYDPDRKVCGIEEQM